MDSFLAGSVGVCTASATPAGIRPGSRTLKPHTTTLPDAILIFHGRGDADSCLATLGSAQVAPGHTETPVVLRAVEILHLLTGHIYHHLTHLQPWNNREDIEVRAGYWDPNPTTSKY
ncbi:hypothetical protein EYF80_031427 [Liparis tanakae]|uniref:Uncharacterized protein n=1 Tax=Liparis tanakae TaxID=230148 RepID=A0A4Z2H0K4_9TELE|nr:hypothetical protein EYF80_031427 [Liparis tanakae]